MLQSNTVTAHMQHVILTLIIVHCFGDTSRRPRLMLRHKYITMSSNEGDNPMEDYLFKETVTSRMSSGIVSMRRSSPWKPKS